MQRLFLVIFLLLSHRVFLRLGVRNENSGAISRDAFASTNKRPTRLIALRRFRPESDARENKSTRIGDLGSTSNDTIVVVVTAPLARLRFCPEQLPPLSPAALRASFSSCRSQRERASEEERDEKERDGARSVDTCSSPARKTDKGRVRGGNRADAGGGRGNERRQRRCQRDDETKQRENGSRTRYGSQELSPVSSEITGSRPRAHVNVPLPPRPAYLM